MLLPISLIEGADDNSLTGAGVDEFMVFQVNSYMGSGLLFLSVVEEYKVSFFQFSFLDFPAILFQLVIGISLQILPINLFLDGRSET